MYASYRSHDNATLSFMEDSFHSFHTFKDDFLLGQASKKVKSNANALRTELMKNRKLDEETSAKTWMSSKKQCTMNSSPDYSSHGIDVS